MLPIVPDNFISPWLALLIKYGYPLNDNLTLNGNVCFELAIKCTPHCLFQLSCMPNSHDEAIVDRKGCLVLIRKLQQYTFRYAAVFELQLVANSRKKQMLNRFVTIENPLP